MAEAWRERFARGERFFKFIGGANLRDLPTVERLATLYALAGAAIMDVAAEPPVVEAALRGFRRARGLIEQRPAWLAAAYAGAAPPTLDPMVMVSITLSGDRHTEIAVVTEAFCVQCDKCTPVCPPGSIVNGVVQDPICTGCGLCVPVCPTECIVLAPRETDPDVDACFEAGARALEIHTGHAAAGEVQEALPLARAWQRRGGLLSYSLDGKHLGYPRALMLAKELGKAGVIIQADGKPISGTSGDRSTIPALRLARAMGRFGTGAWIQPAGGANDRTGPLADRLGVAIAGVGMGSFARRVAKGLEAGQDSEEAWGSIQAKGIEPDIVVPQSKLENLESSEGISEADLRGALDGQAGKKHEDGTPAETKEPTAPEAKDETKKDGEKTEEAKKPISIDHPELAEDYQLARGIDLLRGISLYKSNVVPAGAPELVKAATPEGGKEAATPAAKP